jgi:hypothetical protein
MLPFLAALRVWGTEAIGPVVSFSQAVAGGSSSSGA